MCGSGQADELATAKQQVGVNGGSRCRWWRATWVGQATSAATVLSRVHCRTWVQAPLLQASHLLRLGVVHLLWPAALHMVHAAADRHHRRGVHLQEGWEQWELERLELQLRWQGSSSCRRPSLRTSCSDMSGAACTAAQVCGFTVHAWACSSLGRRSRSSCSTWGGGRGCLACERWAARLAHHAAS